MTGSGPWPARAQPPVTVAPPGVHGHSPAGIGSSHDYVFHRRRRSARRLRHWIPDRALFCAGWSRPTKFTSSSAGRSRVSYGASQTAGNVYYEWPAFLPRIGVLVTKFPVSIFDVNLKDYEAYTTPGACRSAWTCRRSCGSQSRTRRRKRSPISTNSNTSCPASFRGPSGTCWPPTSSKTSSRRDQTLAEAFTAQVDKQLQAWGVETVKNIEFMDIRDSANSEVIANIMAKEKSRIDRESREAVAMNSQMARTKEIEAETHRRGEQAGRLAAGRHADGRAGKAGRHRQTGRRAGSFWSPRRTPPNVRWM